MWFILQRDIASAAQSTGAPELPRRERQLDHLDVQTLAYYAGLDSNTLEPIESEESYVGHDVAVMFYAQWCQNCHTLAPYWDNFATRLKAGTKSSKLIMGLFNCEQNASALKLCSALGVDAYPTLMYFGSGTYHDKNPVTSFLLGAKKSAGHMGPTTVPRSVKFQGNWQYTQSVMDWIKTMKALSSWHKADWVKSLRKAIMFWTDSGGQKILPVGIPTSGNAAVASVSSEEVEALTKELKKKEEAVNELTKTVSFTSKLMDAMNFPLGNGTDPFEVLTTTKGWDVPADGDVVTQVVKSCVMELSMDYCTRYSVHLATEYVDANSDMKEFPSLEEVEAILKKQINETEPYCGVFDDCLVKEFVGEECRPEKCPFQNPTACNYLTACFEESLQKEYAIALKLIEEGDPFPPAPKAGAAGQKAESAEKTGLWGFA